MAEYAEKQSFLSDDCETYTDLEAAHNNVTQVSEFKMALKRFTPLKQPLMELKRHI